MQKLLTTATCEEEADILVARLAEAGIHCMRRKGDVSARWATGGAGHDIVVEEQDLPRARKILEENDGGFDEAELTRLSMEAGEKLREPPTQ